MGFDKRQIVGDDLLHALHFCANKNCLIQVSTLPNHRSKIRCRGENLLAHSLAIAFEYRPPHVRILALQWSDLDAAAKTLRIERAIDETDAYGLRIKPPKTERGKRTITIDADLVALLLGERERHLRIAAGIPDGATVDLSLVKLPAGALMFPNPPAPGESFSFTKLRNPRNTTKEFVRKAAGLGFKALRLHDLRGTHETLLLDAGVPVHVVAARCGHDPAVLLRSYAKRIRKADTSAADIIGALSKGALG
jgi:integrase